MLVRHRILIAIEKLELRFWKLARRLLRRTRALAAETKAGPNPGVATALVWAEDAVAARREEIRVLRARASLSRRVPASRSNATARSPEPSPRLAA